MSKKQPPPFTTDYDPPDEEGLARRREHARKLGAEGYPCTIEVVNHTCHECDEDCPIHCELSARGFGMSQCPACILEKS